FAAAAVNGSHVGHPKVISIGPHGVNGLLETDFDLKPPAIQADDLQRVQGQIGAEQDQGPASRVTHPDKTHQLPQRAPEQILAVIAQVNTRFPIDRAGSLDELLAVTEPVPEMGFGAVGPASSSG